MLIQISYFTHLPFDTLWLSLNQGREGKSGTTIPSRVLIGWMLYFLLFVKVHVHVACHNNLPSTCISTIYSGGSVGGKWLEPPSPPAGNRMISYNTISQTATSKHLGKQAPTRHSHAHTQATYVPQCLSPTPSEKHV